MNHLFRAPLISTLSALLLLPLLVAAQEPVTELSTAVDAVFADLEEDGPGCAVGLIRDGELIYGQGYGLASLEHQLPIDDRTVFYSGSVSKQFVAAAVAMAAREGFLTLDDSVRRWFPELPEYSEAMTVRQLIHHTSGLRDYLTLMALAGVPFETPVSPDWVLGLIARQQSLNFTPGTQFLYSNSGYFLLAQLVGRATGKSLRDYSEETIFAPLGMSDTHWHDDRGEVVARRALAYSKSDMTGYTVNWSPSFAQVGSGGLLTTIQDLLEWDRSFYDHRLGEGFWDGLLETGVLQDGTELDYAFGQFIDEYRGHRRIRHGGAMFGYRAGMVRLPDDSVSIALLCNLASANPMARAAQVADQVLSDLTPIEVSIRSADEAPATTQVAEQQADRIAAWVGSYWSEELAATTIIELKDGVLSLQVGYSAPRSLEVFEDWRMSMPPFVQAQGEVVDGRVEYFVIDAGRVKGIRYQRVELP